MARRYTLEQDDGETNEMTLGELLNETEFEDEDVEAILKLEPGSEVSFGEDDEAVTVKRDS